MSRPSIESKPATETLVRTPLYLSTMEERRATLQRALTPIFAPSKEFVCEFGSGHGHFLVAYALANPKTLCVGVDIDSNRIERANRKQVRAKAACLHFLQADAGLFLKMLPDGVTFTHVFILFPDPWPKKRHHKHRLIQPAFLDDVRRHSTERTRIYFRTDHEPYFESAQAVFAQHVDWQLIDEPWPFEQATVFQSRAASFRSLIAKPRPIAP